MDTVKSKSDLKTKICERLKEARLKAGFNTAKGFTEQKGLKLSTYSLHEAGTRSMSIEVIEHYSDLLEINTSWLLTGIGPRSKTKVREIPVIEWTDIKPYLKNPSKIKSIGSTLSDVDLSPQAFALRVNNDTMEPRYPEGATILVDTEQTPQHKDFAIIQLPDKKEPVFKQLLQVEGEMYAKSLNSDYPAIKLTPQAKILGKVVQAKLLC